MSWHLKLINSADLLSIQFSMVGGYTKDLRKEHGTVKIGTCTRMDACPGTIQYVYLM